MMEAETEGGLQLKQESIEEVDEPSDVNKVKEEMVVGPVVLQKSDQTYIEGNSKVAEVGSLQNRVCISPNLEPDRPEQSENSINVSQQPYSTIKIEPEELDGNNITIRKGAYGRLNLTTEDGHHSGVKYTLCSDGPYMLEVTVNDMKIEYEPPVEPQPNTQDGEEEHLNTITRTHDTQMNNDPMLVYEDTITHSVSISRKDAHGKEDKFHCDICLKRFFRKYNLNRHLLTHTEKKPFICDICDKQFSHKYRLNTHLMVHTKEQTFSCNVCNKQFIQKSKLNSHLFVHTKDKLFSCDVCNKQFSQKYYLIKHLVVHTKEKPFSCNICNKQFSQNFVLKTHLMIHTGEKPFSCDICSKQFRYKSVLRVHLFLHTKERPFTCDICNKQFSLKRMLNAHLVVHTKEKPFTCDICNNQFRHKRNLKKFTHKIVVINNLVKNII